MAGRYGVGDMSDHEGASLSTHRLGVAVVGARRVRQGTGEYVAREFSRAGCTIAGVVGTSRSSVDEACSTLASKYGVECSGYLDLQSLAAEHAVDVVAICSPPDTHAHWLEQAAAFGCHAFCEKPLWWNAGCASDAARTKVAVETLAASFTVRRRHLAINCQWPYTLEAFHRLHGHALSVSSFGMWLSPEMTGSDMMVDSGSHPLSMLHALVGPGEIAGIEARCRARGSAGSCTSLEVRFAYVHARGTVDVALELEQQRGQPKRAGYRVNDLCAERVVELPQYAMSLCDGARRVRLDDPLRASVAEFITAVESNYAIDVGQLAAGMVQLQQLVLATRDVV
jgi:predicted dehydrogenase